MPISRTTPPAMPMYASIPNADEEPPPPVSNMTGGGGDGEVWFWSAPGWPEPGRAGGGDGAGTGGGGEGGGGEGTGGGGDGIEGGGGLDVYSAATPSPVTSAASKGLRKTLVPSSTKICPSTASSKVLSEKKPWALSPLKSATDPRIEAELPRKVLDMTCRVPLLVWMPAPLPAALLIKEQRFTVAGLSLIKMAPPSLAPAALLSNTQSSKLTKA
mmetsp:Transcript_26985/g.88576  ORF Transcript_26985/g.88576 Transcript_26985/m.88576 type:complete len:215 (-) Transcript_26985:484-1128(-)